MYYKSDENTDRSVIKSNNDEDDDEDDEKNNELAEKKLQKLHSYVSDVFDRCVLDEAQKIKSIRIMTHKSILNLNVFIINLLTATFMMNRIIDLVDFLDLL
jgi:SNF2 family DNA or RNA helicase